MRYRDSALKVEKYLMLGEPNGPCEDKHIEELRQYISDERASILADIGLQLRKAEDTFQPLLAAFASLSVEASTNSSDSIIITGTGSPLVSHPRVHVPPGVIARLQEVGDLGTALRMQENNLVFSLQSRHSVETRDEFRLYRDIHQRCIIRLTTAFQSLKYLNSTPPIHNLLLLLGCTRYQAIDTLQPSSQITDMFGRDLGFLAYDLNIDDVQGLIRLVHKDVWVRSISHVWPSWGDTAQAIHYANFIGVYGSVLPRDCKGRTALHIAAGVGNVAFVHWLIDNGADTCAKDDLGRTPLVYAVSSGHAAAASIVLRKTPQKDVDWPNLLLLGIDSGSAAVVKFIITEDYYGQGLNMSHLQQAIDKGNEDVVAQLIPKDYNIEDRDENGRTLLSYAVNKCQEDIARLLIFKFGADVNTKNTRGLTLLMISAGKGHGYSGMVSLLLSSGEAEIDSQDNRGSTAMHWVARSGEYEAADMLIKENADLNVRDNDGWTPLFVAVEAKNDGIMALLLIHGADIQLRDKEGRTVFDIAEMEPDKDILEQLNQYAEDLDDSEDSNDSS